MRTSNGRHSRSRSDPRPNVSKGRRGGESLPWIPVRRRRARETFGRRMGRAFLWVALVSCVGGGTVWLLDAFRPVVSSWFEIRNISIRGNHAVSREDMVKVLPIRQGETLWSFNAIRAVSELEALPWVKEATIFRIPFHTLVVNVTEREPVAIVEHPWKHVVIDEEGRVLSLAPQDHHEYPIIRGIDTARLLRGDRQSRDLAQTGVRVARLLGQAFERPPRVNVSNRANVEVSAGGRRFQFGDSGFLEKWDRYRKVTRALGEEPLGRDDQSERVIDLRYPKKVIVRGRG